jgi:ABC-type sugar transport system permease subunit
MLLGGDFMGTMTRSRNRALFMFLAPAVVLFLFIFAYPLIRTIYLSFFRVADLAGTDLTFRGLKQYKELIYTPLFQTSFKNIFLIWSLGGIALFGWVFLFSMLLNSGIKGKKFFRAVIYLPNLVPAVAMVAMWTQYIYHPRFGFLKTVFETLGLENLAKIQWNSADMLFWGMLIAYVWGGVGWTLIIVLAGIERIPTELYEVARLDGASTFQQFRHVTLPLLRDVLRVTFVFWSIGQINLFTFPKLWTPVVPQEGTYTPAVYLYQISFGTRFEATSTADIGKGAAIAVMLLLLVLLFSFLINRLFREEELEF